ncbi:MAG: hypothetical protein KDC04_03295 [Saprospiraceae bacterium]|nr:hypothetical protein [Saprospiraceae bacterium]
MKTFYHIVSFVFHPLWIITYLTLFLVSFDPYIFGFSNPKAKGLLLISVITITAMFPAIAIGLMKALGLISSFQMKDVKERIAPLVTTGLFYIWLYVNIKNNDLVPTPMTLFVLGSTISIFTALIINIFSKVSLHAIAAGGMVMAIIMILLKYCYYDLVLQVFGCQWIVDQRGIIYFVILLAGIIGTARLGLGAHKSEDVFGGYIVGILSQMLAFNILA